MESLWSRARYAALKRAADRTFQRSARGGLDILTIDYRQAPEATFPAASEDVAAVYRALLKTHKAKDMGIYGCSAGGLLTAQALAWIQKEGLPTPGAAGIFCASADARWGGDAWYWFKPLQGLTSGPTLDERFYYADNDLTDPLMSPIQSESVLKRFPPTLIITATRAGELSSAVNTHRSLNKVGVDAELHIWDGLNHPFFYNADLPESREAFEVMARFFVRHLGRWRAGSFERQGRCSPDVRHCRTTQEASQRLHQRSTSGRLVQFGVYKDV